MLCQKCQLREATVHLTSVPDKNAPTSFTQKAVRINVCEACARNREQELVFGVLGLDLGGASLVWEKLQVLDVTPQWTTVRPIRSEDGNAVDNWRFMTERLPEPSWEVGDVVEIGLDSEALKWLTGESN